MPRCDNCRAQTCGSLLHSATDSLRGDTPRLCYAVSSGIFWSRPATSQGWAQTAAVRPRQIENSLTRLLCKDLNRGSARCGSADRIRPRV